MKLCPICDQQIVKNWCGVCKKFVTPYELSDDIRLNRSHNKSNDRECDYHNQETVEQQKARMDQYEQAQTKLLYQGTAAGSTQRPYTRPQDRSVAKTNPNAKKASQSKAGLIVVIILFLSFFAVPLICSLVAYLKTKEFFSNGLFSIGAGNTTVNPESTYEKDVKLIEADYLDDTARQSLFQLAGYTGDEWRYLPSEVTIEDDSVYFYYDTDVISQMQIECLGGHFPVTKEMLIHRILDRYPGSEADRFDAVNYIQIAEDRHYAECLEEDGIAFPYGYISIQGDSITDEVHELFISYDEGMEMDAVEIMLPLIESVDEDTWDFDTLLYAMQIRMQEFNQDETLDNEFYTLDSNEDYHLYMFASRETGCALCVVVIP